MREALIDRRPPPEIEFFLLKLKFFKFVESCLFEFRETLSLSLSLSLSPQYVQIKKGRQCHKSIVVVNYDSSAVR